MWKYYKKEQQQQKKKQKKKTNKKKTINKCDTCWTNKNCVYYHRYSIISLSIYHYI